MVRNFLSFHDVVQGMNPRQGTKCRTKCDANIEQVNEDGTIVHKCTWPVAAVEMGSSADPPHCCAVEAGGCCAKWALVVVREESPNASVEG